MGFMYWETSFWARNLQALPDTPRHQKHQKLGLQPDMVVHTWNSNA